MPGTVLITGASAGIGRALAFEFARHGHDLILVARRAEVLESLSSELSAKHQVACTVLPTDLALEGAAAVLEQAVQQHRLQVDVLVNNAGVAESGAFADMDPAALDRLIALNIASLTRTTRTFLPPMLEQGWGRVLNVASVAGFQPVVGLGAYAASKAFVLSLTESLAEELRGTGVRVGALCPGLTDTDMVADVSAYGSDLPEVPKALLSDPNEVARQGYACCMRGEVIRVPGIVNRVATFASEVQPRWLNRTIGGFFGRRLLRR